MRQALTVFFILLAAQTGWSLELYRDSTLKELLVFEVLHGLRISKSRACEQGKCLAVKKSKEEINWDKFLEDQKLMPGQIHPAVAFCRALDGTPRTFYQHNRDEIAICAFKDGSLIYAWDLLK